MITSPHVYPDVTSLIQTVAQAWVDAAHTAIKDHGAFYVALAGGNTPRALYQQLKTPPLRDSIDWGKIHLFFGDERSVAWDHPDSNCRMVKESLLSDPVTQKAHFYPMKAELSEMRQQASRYADTLQVTLPKKISRDIPCFDLILLGMGKDGHTASLFPGSSGLHESHRLVTTLYVPSLQTWRMSLTYPIINHAQQIWILITGEDKKPILTTLQTLKEPTRLYPVTLVKPTHGQLQWFLDQSALPH